jgi:hypothetical protein
MAMTKTSMRTGTPRLATEAPCPNRLIRAWTPGAPLQRTLPDFDAQAARDFLLLLTTPPVGCIELRVFRAAFDRRGSVRRGEDVGLGPGFGGTTLAGWFDDNERLIDQASLLRGVSGYVAINPVRFDLLARSDKRLSRVRHTTRDADIACIRWLYLDIDPQRPPEISSTEAELAAALRRRDAILNDHSELASSGAWGSSGNGAWILIRLPDYPNDTQHATMIPHAIAVLDRKYSDNLVRIDTATTNASRLMGLPGTIKAKGCDRPERPWRRVTLDGIGRSLSTSLSSPIGTIANVPQEPPVGSQ